MGWSFGDHDAGGVFEIHGEKGKGIREIGEIRKREKRKDKREKENESYENILTLDMFNWYCF